MVKTVTVRSDNQGIWGLLGELSAQVERGIERYGSTPLAGPAVLVRAMRYSLEAGGKRVRPALVVLSGRACGGTTEQAMPAAVAIEMVHTFSLVHDDLPAMDNDDLRRGKPTSHKAFGEAMAILAGDGLLIGAFEVLTREVDDSATAQRMVCELASASGSAGMTGGQALDIACDGTDLGAARAEEIHRLKTTAMIRAAARLGALSAGADETIIDVLGSYGEKLGLAFQIVDDLLDLSGETSVVGKQTGKDAQAGKPNYAVIVGTDRARTRVDALIDQAIAELAPLGERAESLIELAWFVGERTT